MTDRIDENTILQTESAAMDRRTMMQRSLLGGAVLAGAVLADRPVEAATAGPGDGMVRRVVSGNNAQGKSVVFSDEMIKRDEVWHSGLKEPTGTGFPEDSHKLLPTQGLPGDLPGDQRTRAFFVAIPPAANKVLDRAAVKNWERNAAVAYILATSGEVTYVLDEAEVKLKAGDVLVQRNTNHTWHNHSDAPFTAFVVKVQVQPV